MKNSASPDYDDTSVTPMKYIKHKMHQNSIYEAKLKEGLEKLSDKKLWPEAGLHQ